PVPSAKQACFDVRGRDSVIRLPPNRRSDVLTAFAIVTDGLVYAAYLFLVAVGLTLIFGVMKILNVTHGSFYAFGAYGAATAAGIWFDRGLPDAGGFLFMALFAMAIGLLIGIIIERGTLRFVYGRDEVVVVLVTYAIFLILEDVIVLIWGPRSYAAYQPMVAAGSIDVGDLTLSIYDIGLVVLAGVVAAAGRWALKYTRYGRLLTVVIFDRETAAAYGINVTVVYTVTFLIGAMLGALGGAVMAPKISVTLGIGVEVIVLAFAVVAIGGMGSVEGALIGALIVGISRAAAVHLVPQLELFVIYAVMALVLGFRPYGLFSQVQPRKI
ncbi:MAG: branched-chain amino acid ABC transporter permease, partial [Hyphomicrobiales bacterium]